MNGRRGSALIMALWMIAVLSIMVMSFVYEAHQQSGINVYVRERNRVNRLVDAGQALGEVVLLGYQDAPAWSEDEDIAELLEDDRWIREKRALKEQSKCEIGPILLDDAKDRDGNYLNPATVKVTLETVNSGETGIINVNELHKGAGDSKYMERWWMLFRSHGIPEELDTPKDGTIQLWNILVASWDDWRDEDDTVTAIDGDECGAESDWYEKFEEDNDIDDEDRKRPRNGRIPDIRELSYLRGWREYPEVLTGGVINPWETRKEDQITVRGLEDILCTEGSVKINVNSCKNIDALVTVPGVYEDPEDDDCLEEARAVAQMILDGFSIPPEDRDIDQNLGTWPYKDWHDLTERVDEDIGSEASGYFAFSPETTTVFKMTITGESMGMKREVVAECYVKDGKVRYVKWRED